MRSEYGQNIQDCNIVTESTENINFYVKKATEARKVTFFPKVFGRGFDFVTLNPAVNDGIESY